MAITALAEELKRAILAAILTGALAVLDALVLVGGLLAVEGGFLATCMEDAEPDSVGRLSLDGVRTRSAFLISPRYDSVVSGVFCLRFLWAISLLGGL